MSKVVSKASANAIICDVPDCPERLYSYSSPGVLRKQARGVGFGRASRSKVAELVGMPAEKLGGGRTLDVCSAHRPASKTSGKARKS